MTAIAITAEHLGKSYLIDHEVNRERYTALRDVLASQLKTARQRLRRAFRRRPPAANGRAEEFWALRDVSFEVREGEVLGIIGRNGAGKSTLLKVLSRITEPSAGRVTLRGRVGTLLEVGTGFHPELTGRENIFLNGAILGMTRAEIKRKFDEIVGFAEVERFLDTPVKRYSSGMYVRLAFAVAAHLEPEILVVDEVLAVGDAEFQKKCLGKMQDVSRGGRTLLFVSHNMAAIEALCPRVTLLTGGKIEHDGDAATGIRKYLTSTALSKEWNPTRRHRGRAIQITNVQLLVADVVCDHVNAGQSCTLRIAYTLLDKSRLGGKLSVSIMLFANGQKLVNLWTDYSHSQAELKPAGFIHCHIPKWPFRNAQFRVDVYTSTSADVEEWLEECLVFDSYDGDYYGTGIITNPDQGIQFLNHSWTSNANQ